MISVKDRQYRMLFRRWLAFAFAGCGTLEDLDAEVRAFAIREGLVPPQARSTPPRASA